jgi:hypothetical protein
MIVKLSSREIVVENELVARVKAAGGSCDKVRSSGRGYFDRIVVLPGMVRARIVFVELKRPKGGRLSAHQIQRHALYRALGAELAVVKDSADIDALMTRK